MSIIRCGPILCSRSTLFLALMVVMILSGFILYNRTSHELVPFSRSGPSVAPKTETPDSISGLSGKLFPGTVVRSFADNRRRFLNFVPSSQPAGRVRRAPWCERWAVVSTVYKPSEAAKREVTLRDWCLVIVGDQKSKSLGEDEMKQEKEEFGEDEMKQEIEMEREGGTTVYLTSEAQLSMQNAFVDSIPWNCFGRKNVGYLYAIMHGATTIWDFDDDDDILKLWIPDEVYTVVLRNNHELVEVQVPMGHQWPTYNPYPALGAPVLPSWPRGLPMSDVKEPLCSSSLLEVVNFTVRRESVAVLQFVADYQPDVDAIYRLTMPIPFSFTKSTVTKPLMTPPGALSPYNAQATLHFEAALFGLLLPVTVHRRVADIWRSYFTQRLLWDTDHQIGFKLHHPLGVQDSNCRNTLGDLEAERDVYMKSKHLVEFLGSWKGKGNTVVERMEELWIALYEQQYIEAYDVEVVQLWLQSLLDAGYKFPDVKTATASVPVPMYPSLDTETTKDMEICTTDKRLTFWSFDVHDGSRIDMPSLFARLGHKTVVAGINDNGSPFVLEREGVSTYSRISPTLNNYTTHSTA